MRVVGGTAGRVYEFWSSKQRAGKTYSLKARAVDLARHASVHSVWVLDRLGEWDPASLPLKSVAIWHDLSELSHASEMPRLVIWRRGTKAEAYTAILAEAHAIGDVAIIIDEAYEFAPSGARWTGSDDLQSIVLAGAHLPRREDRELRPTHLIVAAQYPKSVHHLIWAQAYTVCVGQSSGENTFVWLRQNFNTPTYDAESAVASLPPYRFECVRGEMPNLPRS